MPTTVTESDVFTASLSVPNDTELATRASLEQFVQGLANRTRHLFNRSVMSSATGVWIHVPLAPVLNDNARFTHTDNDGWIQSSVASAGKLRFPVPCVLHSGKINRVRARVAGLSDLATHVALPATKPTLNLLRMDSNFAAPDTLAGIASVVTDPSASFTDYNLIHTIELDLSALSITFAENYVYYVDLTGETGANSVANALHLRDIRLQVVAT